MLFKPLLGDQLSGSVGGVTASRNAGGAYFRQRALPVNPNSVYQQAVRGYFSQLAAAWGGTLTEAQRNAWTSYAENTPVTNRIGDSIVLSGLAMYQRSNVARLQAGLARVDDGPGTFGLPEFTGVSWDPPDAAADTVDVNFTNTDVWANEDGGALLVYASRPQSPSINYFKGPYRFMGSVAGNGTTAPTSPATMTLPFVTTAGQKIFFYARCTEADGRLSSTFRGFGVSA